LKPPDYTDVRIWCRDICLLRNAIQEKRVTSVLEKHTEHAEASFIFKGESDYKEDPSRMRLSDALRFK
jgi:hypothetical protein